MSRGKIVGEKSTVSSPGIFLSHNGAYVNYQGSGLCSCYSERGPQPWPPGLRLSHAPPVGRSLRLHQPQGSPACFVWLERTHFGPGELSAREALRPCSWRPGDQELAHVCFT